MKNYIKKQLQQVQLANLSNFNIETNTFIIPKYSEPLYELNKCYIVKVSDDLINNTTNVLATNWNRNTAPRAAYLKAYVSKILGSMIYVDTIAFDYNTKTDLDFMWSGWLPIKNLTQLLVI